MNRFTALLLLPILALPVSAGDWLTFAADAQRTGWAKSETRLTKDNVGTLKLEWSLKVDNAPRELFSLTVPVIATNVITPKGFKDIVLVAGTSDNLYSIDADTGKILWQRKFTTDLKPKNPNSHWLCPNALEATPFIDKKTRTVHLISLDGKLRSLNIVNGEDTAPPAPFVQEFSKNWSLNVIDGVVYTALSQHCNGAKNGVYGLDLKDPSHPVTTFTTAGGIWGRAGVAAGSDGRLYAEIGDGTLDIAAGKYSDAVIALEPKTLKLSDYYVPANQRWVDKKDLDMGNISPVVFPFGKSELIAASGKEGVIYLLDSKSLGGADHKTPLYRSPLFTNEDVDFAGKGFWGAMSTWEDADHTRWLYAPAYGPPHSEAPKFPLSYGPTPNGSIMAFKVEAKDGKPVLTPAWMSSNLSVPEPVVIAGGMVFALSNGEDVRQVDSAGKILTSKERINTSGHAVLYAFDAATGKELFNSGNTITGFTHFSGLSISEGRLYVVTLDSTIYAFGLGQ